MMTKEEKFFDKSIKIQTYLLEKLALQAKSVLWIDISKYFAGDYICNSKMVTLHLIWRCKR